MTHLLHLPSELTIYNVAELHAEWIALWGGENAIAQEDEFVVHADQVARIDAAGVQLLMSLRRFIVSRGARPRFADASAMLKASCASLGVFALLGASEPIKEAS